jgi:hypothetical protein
LHYPATNKKKRREYIGRADNKISMVFFLFRFFMTFGGLIALEA